MVLICLLEKDDDGLNEYEERMRDLKGSSRTKTSWNASGNVLIRLILQQVRGNS